MIFTLWRNNYRNVICVSYLYPKIIQNLYCFILILLEWRNTDANLSNYTWEIFSPIKNIQYIQCEKIKFNILLTFLMRDSNLSTYYSQWLHGNKNYILVQINEKTYVTKSSYSSETMWSHGGHAHQQPLIIAIWFSMRAHIPVDFVDEGIRDYNRVERYITCFMDLNC